MVEMICAENLSLGYAKDAVVIKNANFTINQNDFVFITGQSGSGKSTLLRSFYGDMNIMGGSLQTCGCQLNGITEKNLELLRQRIGIIFQNYRLINEWSVEKNVMLPLAIKGYSADVSRTQAQNLLKHVKLSHKSDKFPLELSGGEQQRVAMARAMAHNPVLLLCDEPTGNLDDYSSEIIWALLEQARKSWNACVVVVTHKKPATLRFAYRHFEIKNGEVNEIN